MKEKKEKKIDEKEYLRLKRSNTTKTAIIIVLAFTMVLMLLLIVIYFANGKKFGSCKDDKKVSWKLEEGKDLTCAAVITQIYEDDEYTYSVSSPCVADETYVVYSNGEKYNIKDALSEGKVTIAELEEKNFTIYKDHKSADIYGDFEGYDDYYDELDDYDDFEDYDDYNLEEYEEYDD